MALGLGDPPKKAKRKLGSGKKNGKDLFDEKLRVLFTWGLSDDDLIFNMEEINQIPENGVPSMLNTQSSRYRQKSPQRKKGLTQRHASIIHIFLNHGI